MGGPPWSLDAQKKYTKSGSENPGEPIQPETDSGADRK